MDELLRLAYERRERLRRELALVENLITEHERLESSTRRMASDNYQLELVPPSSPKRRRAAVDNSALFDAAERLILAEGKPLSRSQLMTRLERDGFEFPGTDKAKVFGTNLWRSRRFISLKGLGYWPEAHPLPAVYRDIEQRSSMLK